MCLNFRNQWKKNKVKKYEENYQKEKGYYSKNDADDDSITQHMLEEVHQRIKSKRRRNKEMLDKFTQKIKEFDNNYT